MLVNSEGVPLYPVMLLEAITPVGATKLSSVVATPFSALACTALALLCPPVYGFS